MAAPQDAEQLLTTEPPHTTEGETGEAKIVGQRRWGRFVALGAVGAALLVVAGLAAAASGRRPTGGPMQAADAVEDGEVEELFKKGKKGPLGPFGELAGPSLNPQDYLVGSIPRFSDWAAHHGSPPKKKEKPSKKCPAGCKGKCCNGGKLCCGKKAICCGTSCCSGGSICCNRGLGLCCAKGTMCCWGKMCCAPSWTCGKTRSYGEPLRYNILKACGGGAQFRRLLDEQRYKHDFRRLLASNETALKELMGIPEDDDGDVDQVEAAADETADAEAEAEAVGDEE